MPDVAANPSEGDDDTDDDTDDDSVSGAQRPGVPAIVAHVRNPLRHHHVRRLTSSACRGKWCV